MDEMEIKKYVNAEQALARIRGNVKLFKMLLANFLETTQVKYEELQKEIGANDRDAASKTVHAIKGVAANLSMTALYELCPPFEALLKTDADASESLAGFGEAYKKTVESVNALLPTLPA